VPLRVGLRDVPEETIDSARLERVLEDSVRRRSSLDELSLLPVNLPHMLYVVYTQVRRRWL
jgi:hypothetical protein